MITVQDVENVQQIWGSGVVKIGSLKNNRIECEAFCGDFLDQLYAFELGNVLFKPYKMCIRTI